MKRSAFFLLALALFGLASSKLLLRYRQERADRRYVIYADWVEVRQAAARLPLSDRDVMKQLSQSGVGGLLVGVSPVQEYLWQDMTFARRESATAVLEQLRARGMVRISMKPMAGGFRLISGGAPWDRLKEVELGFNPTLIQSAQDEQLHLMLRVEQDGWTSVETVFKELDQIASRSSSLAVLFSSDLLPGGMNAVAAWTAWVQSHEARVPFFEFKPAKGARLMVARSPGLSRRAHTIPANELKELTSETAQARWRRAVRERGCRYLLIHMSPDDSLATFITKIQALRDDLARAGYVSALPAVEPFWAEPSRGLFLRSWLCLAIAILIPALALLYGRTGNAWSSFFAILLLTIAGASVMAAIADTPFTRLHVTPFRGVKMAVLLGWAGCFGVLFTIAECRGFLNQSLRRVDLVLLGFFGVTLLYLLLRTGNAGANWKSGWEQSFRHHLEQWMIARPRFKEFAIGYPLLILGLHEGRGRLGRVLVGLGMIGPVSVVNTFCHLHSPLILAYWRTANGVVLGLFLGWLFLRIRSWLPSR